MTKRADGADLVAPSGTPDGRNQDGRAAKRPARFFFPNGAIPAGGLNSGMKDAYIFPFTSIYPDSYMHGRNLTSRVLLIASAVCLVLVVGCGQESPYRAIESDAEDGTGREYMGREIADVMTSEHGALWLDRPQRDEEELPQRLLRALNLNASDVVADIGSGTGFFTFRIAERVPSGRVYAVEVQQALVDTIRVRAERRGFRNVTPVLGAADNPALPENRLDVALIVSSYHEFAHPREMLVELVRALKPGGRLVLVEYRAEDVTTDITDLHRMSEEQIIREGEAVGLNYRETIDVLPQQHIVVFTAPLD